MRLTLNRSCVLTGAAVLALLAGSLLSAQEAVYPVRAARPCVGSGPESVAQPFLSEALPEELSRALSGVGVPSMIVISDSVNNLIDIFKEDGTMLATLTGNGLNGPEGMTSDRLGNIYVANTFGGNILIYAPPYTAPPTSIVDTDRAPAGVAQRDNGAFLGVTNAIGNNCGPGTVTFFRNGVEVGNVTDANFQALLNGAFDHAGNFYFDGLAETGEPFVAVIAHATTGVRTVQYLTTDNAVYSGGIQVTNVGLIAIGDQVSKPQAIYSYNPPVNGSLGSPVYTTPLNNSGDVKNFAFKVHNRNLYTADDINLETDEYAYPAGGNAENTITFIGGTDSLGVAVIPAQIP